MAWSFRIGRVFGIDVYVHATFAILLAWIAVEHYLRQASLVAALGGVLFTLAVFAMVVLHELGHALTARQFGVRTRDITLLPIGGVARLERMPEKPSEEFLVAIAGPLVNVLLAVILWAVLLATAHAPLMPDLALIGLTPFLVRLFWVNVMLAGFNLIPAFPMDGGRVLRALLAMRGDYVQATHTAARVGQGIALLLGIVGLFLNPFLVFIALFVWIGAAAESGAADTKAALLGLPVHAGMITEYRVLYDDDTLETAARALVSGAQVDFPVSDRTGRLVGVLTRAKLVDALSRGTADESVVSAMETGFEVAEANEPMEVAAARLSGSGQRALPVVHEGRLVGLVTMESVAELMLVRGALGMALRRARRSGSAGFSPTASAVRWKTP